ncbi:MAG: hypothetical protein PHW27_09015 [Melioribacteraceae bacterium]|nr:hypothetical protein [Melioribacteraceae bacterium]
MNKNYYFKNPISSRITFLLLISYFLFLNSCNSTEPPPPPPVEKSAVLSVTDFSLNEIWLDLFTENLTNSKQVNLFRDVELLNSFELIGNDTTLVVDSLLPQKQYSFSVVIYDGDNDTIKTNSVNASSMDTTSHNFSWEIFTFGEGFNNSILRDVAIIDENNIWAVGEIRIGEEKYNAVQWDGEQWNLRKIIVTYRGNPSYAPLLGVFSLPTGEVIFSSGVPYLPSDNGWIIQHLWDMGVLDENNGIVTSIWGTGLNDLYVVGDFGTIAHYNGTNWRAMESGTDLALVDVYGSQNGNIYAAGSYSPFAQGIILRKELNNNWEVMIEGDNIDEAQLFEKLFGSTAAIWIDERNVIYTGGHILYEYKNNHWNYIKSLAGNHIGGNTNAEFRGFISGIRGNGSNDWVMCGQRNTLQHFNGSTRQQLGMEYNPLSGLNWTAVEQKSNTIAAVGFEGNRAKIILLRR